jgi:hypothetical protein
MENNHGKVGEALYLKYTLENFNKSFKNNVNYEDKTELSINELSKYGLWSAVPVLIDKNTQGNYECVCEFGVEVH